ncbi:hypothetical protein [Amedibacterium intestinale]|mgnify:CR=1 FL=1|uniref:hypothetical protein n=1 Tax=Amedibacterium intestinale TaxID=2583452 RepID=UPI00399268F8
MSNPLFNIMNPNPMNLVKGMMNGNPQDMLMNMLKQQNPQGYQQLQQLMNSGQDPNKILEQMMGNLNPQQKAQIQQMAKQFGIR